MIYGSRWVLRSRWIAIKPLGDYCPFFFSHFSSSFSFLFDEGPSFSLLLHFFTMIWIIDEKVVGWIVTNRVIFTLVTFYYWCFVLDHLLTNVFTLIWVILHLCHFGPPLTSFSIYIKLVVFQINCLYKAVWVYWWIWASVLEIIHMLEIRVRVVQSITKVRLPGWKWKHRLKGGPKRNTGNKKVVQSKIYSKNWVNFIFHHFILP